MTKSELLKNTYGITAINNEVAQNIFESLEKINKLETSGHYAENDSGKLTYFFPQILASKILKGRHVLNTTKHEDDTLLYEDGVYKNTDTLRKEINNNLDYMDPKPEKNRKDTLKEIREIGLKNSHKANKHSNLINFKNGMFNIETGEMLKHSPKYYSTIQINYNYYEDKHKNKSLDDTLFGHLINKSLEHDTKTILQEIFGYCLCMSMEAQKFFIFVGKANNGKSQVLNVLNSFFDKKFVSSLELKHFQDDVRVHALYNKQLNICADISSEYIEDDSILKRATGEDEIHCNPKYRDGFDFFNQAKLIFSCNELPNVADKTLGFMRRLIIVPFDKIIQKKDKIPSIGRLITQNIETMELIISWAMDGLKRLIKNNWDFSEVGRIEEAKKDFELENNSVKKFIYNMCAIDNNANSKNYVLCTEFKHYYEQYCKDEGINMLSYKKMKMSIDSLNIIKAKNTLYKGWYYQGISFKYDIKEISNQIDINSSLLDEENNNIENPK